MIQAIVLVLGTLLLVFLLLVLGRVLYWNLRGRSNRSASLSGSRTDGDPEWPVVAEDHLDQTLNLMVRHLHNHGIHSIVEAEDPTITEGAVFLLRSRLRVPPAQIDRARGVLTEADFELNR